MDCILEEIKKRKANIEKLKKEKVALDKDIKKSRTEIKNLNIFREKTENKIKLLEDEIDTILNLDIKAKEWIDLNIKPSYDKIFAGVVVSSTIISLVTVSFLPFIIITAAGGIANKVSLFCAERSHKKQLLREIDGQSISHDKYLIEDSQNLLVNIDKAIQDNEKNINECSGKLKVVINKLRNEKMEISKLDLQRNKLIDKIIEQAINEEVLKDPSWVDVNSCSTVKGGRIKK